MLFKFSSSGDLVSRLFFLTLKFEPRLDIDGSNLYSVPNRRASQVFDSQDDLLISGKKSDFDSRPIINKTSDDQPIYSNTLPLSASYDDRMWFGKPKNDVHVSSESSSLETSFEARSNNSYETSSLNCYSSDNHKPCSHNSPKNLPKRFHFRSENSLHCDDLTTYVPDVDKTDPKFILPARPKKISHGQSVPHLYADSNLKTDIQHRTVTNQHSINQAVDLVQASVYLQGGKRSTSTTSLKYPSPKTKTKEWIETSLDSPLPPRKQRSKDHSETKVLSDKQLNSMEINLKHFELQSVRLSPFPKSPAQTDLESKHCVEMRKLSTCYNRSPPIIDPNHDSVYYEPSVLNESVLTDDCFSLQNYCAPESENVSLNAFHGNSHVNACKYSSVSDIASVYSDYCDRTISCFENTSHSIPQTFHPPPLKNPESQENNERLHFPQPLRHNTTNVTNNIHSVHYADSSIINVHVSSQPSLQAQQRQLNSAEVPSYQFSDCSNLQPFQFSNSVSNIKFEMDDIPKENIPVNPNLTSLPIKQFQEMQPFSYDTEIEPLAKNIQDARVPISPDYNANIDSPTRPIQEIPSSLSPHSPVPISFTPAVEVNVVSVGHFQPYWEETKPYELSDFYKYSTKHRKHSSKQSDNLSPINSPTESTNSSYSEYWTSSCSNIMLQSHTATKEIAPVSSNYVPKQEQSFSAKGHVTHVNSPDYSGNHGSYEKQPLNTVQFKSEIYDAERASLAESFHDEMVSWYEKREAVKKATLV